MAVPYNNRWWCLSIVNGNACAAANLFPLLKGGRLGWLIGYPAGKEFFFTFAKMIFRCFITKVRFLIPMPRRPRWQQDSDIIEWEIGETTWTDAGQASRFLTLQHILLMDGRMRKHTWSSLGKLQLITDNFFRLIFKALSLVCPKQHCKASFDQ